jgi:hypothetical protein
MMGKRILVFRDALSMIALRIRCTALVLTENLVTMRCIGKRVLKKSDAMKLTCEKISILLLNIRNLVMDNDPFDIDEDDNYEAMEYLV